MAPCSDRTRLIAAATRRGRGRRPVNPPIERGSTLLNDRAALMRDPAGGPVYGIEDLGAAAELRAALSDLEGAIWTGLVLKGGSLAPADALRDSLTLFGLGFSWGGFESLITHETAQLTHRLNPPSLAGPLLRLHVGLEDPADLITDLEQGFAAWRAQQDSNLQPSA
jgi:cystathionine beta-lyase/cystathionine gamma-synthase